MVFLDWFIVDFTTSLAQFGDWMHFSVSELIVLKEFVKLLEGLSACKCARIACVVTKKVRFLMFANLI